jgi:hypothetical protein
MQSSIRPRGAITASLRKLVLSKVMAVLSAPRLKIYLPDTSSAPYLIIALVFDRRFLVSEEIFIQTE